MSRRLPTAWKTTIAGLLAAGIPEIGMVASVAIMGKEGFARLKGMLGRWLAPVAPPDRVSAAHYRVGLVLFAAPLALAWLGPSFVYAIGGDVMLLVSFFMLGGEFWDKLRALFTQDVRVVPATALPREE